MKRIAFIILVFLGLAAWGLWHPVTWSADGESLFQSKCGRCHVKGGEAPVFGPVKYASVQWERFFKRNKHKRKKDISTEFTPEEIVLIRDYLVAHAADSDRPIAAGLK